MNRYLQEVFNVMAKKHVRFLGLELTKAVDEGKVKLDLGGHFHSTRKYSAKELFGGFMVAIVREQDLGKPGWPTRQQVLQLEAWLRDETGTVPMVYDVPMQNMLRYAGMGIRRCHVCGQDDLHEGAVLNGDKIVLTKRCPYPRGIPDLKLRLYCPSGKLVVANDLRRLFPTVGPELCINYEAGRVMTSRAYAAVGMIHLNVGNTCPSVYRVDQEHFTVGPKPPKRGARSVANICTDLWWYSVADYDEYLRRIDTKLEDVTVVKCRPGVYEFKHQLERLRQQDQEDDQPYTFIRWVAERPRRLPNYQREYTKYNFTAGQVIRHCMESWPTLYKERRTYVMGARRACNLQESVAMVADHIFFTIGNGLNYHPRGWIGGCAEMGVDPPDLKIPVLNKPLPHPYPLSDFSFIAVAVGLGDKFCAEREDNIRSDGTLYLNPSFVALGFNLLRALLLYGEEPVDKLEDEEKRWPGIIKLARRCIVRLAQQYPDQVPKNCLDLLKSLQNGQYRAPKLAQRVPGKRELKFMARLVEKAPKLRG